MSLSNITKHNDFEYKLRNLIQKNLSDLKLFFTLFILNIFIYGQKIFYYSLPADDYMRFYGDDNTKLLITNSARWAQALLNDYIFNGALQILPYLHGVTGIFSFTLMGFLTAKFFKRSNFLEIATVTLLISVTPMFAHNLFFSTNITAWITLSGGLIGFMLANKKSLFAKFFGFLLLIIAIGNYQTVIQIILIIILIKMILELLEIQELKEIKPIILSALGYTFFLLLAYISSYMINEIFLSYHHWHAEHRLAKASIYQGWYAYVERIKYAYETPAQLDYFKTQFYFLYKAMAFLSVLSVFTFIMLKENINIKSKLVLVLCAGLLFSFIPLILNLPLLMGLQIPPRAHFTIGWALAGLFMLQQLTVNKYFHIISHLLTVSILIVSIYYITLFFDAGIRQTQADIRRANIIVQRIRLNENYTQEPVKLLITGGRKFNVLGWDLKFEQPFSTHWAKYKIFKYFTDFHFSKMSAQEWNEVKEYLIKKNEKIYDYPGKNSVIVYKNKAIVFFDASEINMVMHKKQYIAHFPKTSPDVNATFNLYYQDNILFYEKLPCTNEDFTKAFFLRIYPGNPNEHIPDIAPHTTMDFYFEDRGIKQGNRCIAAVPLPKIKIGRIYTGQFKRSVKVFWEANLNGKVLHK